jgi:hypothetical protein
MKLKIYISGAITGLRLADAKNNFEAMEQILRNAGHEPINPMKIGLPEHGDHSWAEYMCADMPFLFEADAIYMLENWQRSKGARIEKAIMEIMEKPVYYQASNIPHNG